MKFGTVLDVMKPLIYLVIILGLVFVPIYNLSTSQMISQDPAWVNSSLLLIAVCLVFFLAAPVFRIAYSSIRLSPLEFFDDFVNSEEGQYLCRALDWHTIPEMRKKVRELWTGKAPAEYVRHQACQFVAVDVQRIRMYVLRVLLTTLPIITLSFAVISLTGQRLGAWQITKGAKLDGSAVLLGSLLEHLYFCVSVFSTLGIGDTRPLIDEHGFGEAFVITMLSMFMITGLVVFGLVISFIHSLFPAIQGAVDNAINDVSMDIPRPCPVFCPLEPYIDTIQRIESNQKGGKKNKDKH